MTEVYLVEAVLDDGRVAVLAAYAERGCADAHAFRCTRERFDDQGHPLMTAVELFGIRTVTVRPLTVVE